MLVNASPDLRQQIEACPTLHPRDKLRHSPVAAVVLTGSEVDAVAGLLVLRESQPFTLHATGRVLQVLEANPIFRALSPDYVERCAVVLEQPFTLPGGLSAELFAVPGKVALYLEHGRAELAGEPEDTVGIVVEDAAGARCFFVPGCARMTPELAERLRGAALVFFDGTLWTDNEMIREGSGAKTGKRMGHMSVGDPDGTIAAFQGLGVQRKVLIHINNSNPLVLDDSAERAIATDAGWEVAYDGMEVSL